MHEASINREATLLLRLLPFAPTSMNRLIYVDVQIASYRCGHFVVACHALVVSLDKNNPRQGIGASKLVGHQLVSLGRPVLFRIE